MSQLKTSFSDLDTIVKVIQYDEDSVTDYLKPAVYSVDYNLLDGFFLNKHSSHFEQPDKVYGKIHRRVGKIIHSYSNSESSFGVLLSGSKGSGKTMTSCITANRCIHELGLPIILVQNEFNAFELSSFIQKLGEVVVFFDEFGKNFKNEDGNQNGLLTLFDGTGSDKRLVILTENNVWDINNFMLERPGRIHYHFRHDKLDEEMVREYCSDYDIPENKIEQICLLRESSMDFSFDTLQAVVTEYLKYPDDIFSLVEDLNIEQPISMSQKMLEITEITDQQGNSRTLWNKRHKTNNVVFPEGFSETELFVNDVDEQDWRIVLLDCGSIVKREGNNYVFHTSFDNDQTEHLVIKGRYYQDNFKKSF
ncbi:hypothetical protein PBI_SCTP2_384 [Salicola phage SCTP-2]|nr:hypothetical protein PBI_SCTP2_384 [Salicola phage SCTP-2]